MTDVEEQQSDRRSTARRLIRSYGLLILLALAFLLMALFVREKERTVPVESMPLPAEITGAL
ncbi:MAG TPA: hypothetical protein VFA34_16710 [Actinomycetota bacterium]|jgi:hypothetical protein|nr:hypothetical protein [Actinomycetota bacterium]